jgi:poly-gamma-glutamate synthesis protein (capsule biosynthesis protein)
MKVLIAGDYCERFRVEECVAARDYNKLFDKAVCKYIQTADYSIVNFEFPIVVGDKKPLFKCGPNLKGTSLSAEAIKYAGFKCASLANNHILDYGTDAMLDTKRILEEIGIDTVGVGENLDDASSVLFKNVNGKSLAIINCCEHEFSLATPTSPGANPLNPVRQFYNIQEARKRADYVLVIVHGGHEHWQLPSPRMVELYHYFVDCGADAVVNHHQHCYSGSEVYHGKPIIYGLGNFCFDIQPLKKNDIWNCGCMAEIVFSSESVEYRLIPIEQCDDNVGVHLSNQICFEKRQSELNAIISNSKLLSEKTYEYYKKSIGLCASIMNPTLNRYLLALQKRKLLPTPLTKEWLIKVQNFVLCESHRDKLEYYFEHFDQ